MERLTSVLKVEVFEPQQATQRQLQEGLQPESNVSIEEKPLVYLINASCAPVAAAKDLFEDQKGNG